MDTSSLAELDTIAIREFIRDKYPNRSIVATGNPEQYAEYIMRDMFPELKWVWIGPEEDNTEYELLISTDLIVGMDLDGATLFYPSIRKSLDEYADNMLEDNLISELVYGDEVVQIDVILVTDSMVFLNILDTH